MRIKLDRWAGNPTAADSKRKIHTVMLEGGSQEIINSTSRNSRTELCIELDVEYEEEAEIELQVFARYGGRLQIEYYEEGE